MLSIFCQQKSCYCFWMSKKVTKKLTGWEFWTHFAYSAGVFPWSLILGDRINYWTGMKYSWSPHALGSEFVRPEVVWGLGEWETNVIEWQSIKVFDGRRTTGNGWNVECWIRTVPLWSTSKPVTSFCLVMIWNWRSHLKPWSKHKIFPLWRSPTLHSFSDVAGRRGMYWKSQSDWVIRWLSE